MARRAESDLYISATSAGRPASLRATPASAAAMRLPFMTRHQLVLKKPAAKFSVAPCRDQVRQQALNTRFNRQLTSSGL